jgi:2-dehydrotetronate isomerase
MPRFSANLGFLWVELPLPEAIRAAHRAGFDAVECHWPYAFAVEGVAAALRETGLKMLGLNTRRGQVGENGLSALVGRGPEARAAIDEALDYGANIGALNVHVMAGVARGPQAEAQFLENLEYAARKAAEVGLGILIEPLNHFDVPGYFLHSTTQAAKLIATLGSGRVKLMFDCYHIQILEGDLTRKLSNLLPIIGHIQFASVPMRGTPDEGEIDYAHIFKHIDTLAYKAPLGAEYRPQGATEQSLVWLNKFTK